MQSALSALVALSVLSPLLGASPFDTESEKDMDAVRAAHSAEARAFHSTGDEYFAHNRSQDWTLRFDGASWLTTPRSGEWSWELALLSWGFVGAMCAVEGPACVAADGYDLTYAWSDDLTEWFVNGSSGVEHGFTVHRRPQLDASDETTLLQFALDVRGTLEPVVSSNGRNVSFVDAEGNRVVNYSGLRVFDAASRDLPAGFEARDGRLFLTIDEQSAQYPLTIDPLAQQAYLKASNTGAGDGFGSSVAIDGDTAVVGASTESGAGTGTSGGASEPDQANNAAPGAGAAYVYVRSPGGSWAQQAYLKASNTDFADFFGESVAISGDTIVVGATGEASGSASGDQADNSEPAAGAAYVFVRSGDTWTQQAYLKSFDPELNDTFGRSVAISGDLIAVSAVSDDGGFTGIYNVGSPGAPDFADNSADGSGAVILFRRIGGVWSPEAYVKSSNSEDGDLFGYSLGLDQSTLVVGAILEDSGATGVDGIEGNNSVSSSGAAYVFEQSSGAWSQSAYLKASNTGLSDNFGASVAVSGNRLVVGASGESSAATGVNGDQTDNSLSAAGAAYAFERTGATWAQDAYLKASANDSLDLFGAAVVISGNTILIACFNDDSCATGIDSDPVNNACTNAGAVSVFAHDGTNWQQHAYLKTANSEAGDLFGFSVAVAQGTAIVGSPSEDSSAIGVDGNGSNNSASLSGAAYVFELGVPQAQFRNSGTNPASYTADVPVVGTIWTGTVDLTTTGHSFAFLLGYAFPTELVLSGGQTVLVIGSAELLGLSAVTGPSATFGIGIPLDPSLCGTQVFTQALHVGGVSPYALSNAQDLVIGV